MAFGRRTLFEAQGSVVGVLERGHAITVSIGNHEVYAFDLLGRLYSAFDGDRHYRRGLNGGVLEAWRCEGMPQERWLTEGEGVSFLSGIHQRVAQVLVDPSVQKARGVIAQWDQRAYMAQANQFKEIYRPVSILPPDQYLSVVVQATEGCSWNRCRFCDFYRDRPFRVRSREELDRHIDQLRTFMGDGLAMRRSVFLGDANALSVSWSALVGIFEAVQAGFPIGKPGPSWQQIYGFVDVFGGKKRTVEELTHLKGMGLRRVYVGLETGHDALLAKVNKRGNGDLAVDVIRRFKTAGISVGVIVLLGLGGTVYANKHVQDTIEVLNAMALGTDDLIYFSPLVASPELSYTQDMAMIHSPPLSWNDMQDQWEEIEKGITVIKTDRPKMAQYHIRRFVY